MGRSLKVGVAVLVVLMLVTILTAVSVASTTESHDFTVKGKIGPVGDITSSPSPNPTPEPGATPTTGPDPTLPSTGSGNTGSPKTGDETNIMLYATIALLSMVILVLLWRNKGDRHAGKGVPQGS